jgi:hypothetical protein
LTANQDDSSRGNQERTPGRDEGMNTVEILALRLYYAVSC